MKTVHLVVGFGLMFSTYGICGQTNQTPRLFLPFFSEESQSNVDVKVIQDQPCPSQFTNVLSNMNLFTPEEQTLLKQVFVKYINVTTNSGPLGSVQLGQYETNFLVKAMGRTVEVKKHVSLYQYPDSGAREEIQIGPSLFANLRNMTGSGYNVSIVNAGGRTLLSFREFRKDQKNGLFVRFLDTHDQGRTWDYSLASFTNSPLTEYCRYTNGMALGKLFMWNPDNGHLMIQAEFKQPFDWQKSRLDLQW